MKTPGGVESKRPRNWFTDPALKRVCAAVGAGDSDGRQGHDQRRGGPVGEGVAREMEWKHNWPRILETKP